MTHIKTLTLVGIAALAVCGCKEKYAQPEIGARKVEIIEEDGYKFKDLNKNGKLDVYEDWRKSTDERVADLLSQMTVEEKAGILFHPNIAVKPDGKVVYDAKAELSQEAYKGPVGPGGAGAGAMQMGQVREGADVKTFIEERHFRSILNNGVAEPKVFATWSNSMQEYAEASRLGIPIMFSSDPRHGATLGAHVSGRQVLSQWPSKEGWVGVTATGDIDLMEKFGEAVAKEYRAIGLHMILGPQIDAMTDPRWSRNMGCFSEDAELTSQMLEAFMKGAQGESVGPDKVLVHLKHWPGAAPHKDGQGEWLVYPGDNLDYQLKAWKKGFEKGALAVMGYYSGTYVDTLNVCYSPYWSNKVLREELGFKGALCTDWGVVGRVGPMNPRLAGKTTLKDNMALVINAGTDQMGSETESQLVVELVNEGRISQERLDEAAGRILQWHFLLGLFENPYVDPDKAEEICQKGELQENALQAQHKSVILLTNGGRTLPIAEGKKLFVEGIDREIASAYGTVVETPEEADVIIMRTGTTMPRVWGAPAPQPQRPRGGKGQARQPQAAPSPFGSDRPVDISIPDPIWGRVKELKASGKPVVVAFNPSGSGVVLPQDLSEQTDAVLMVFDVLDDVLMDVVCGRFSPVGKLPFEIPATMDDVRGQVEDVPFDAPHKSFEFGYGLTYSD